MKLGAPNKPNRSAASVCARSRALIASDWAAASAGRGSTCNPASTSPMDGGVVDAPAFGEFRAEHRAAEIVAPGFLARNVLLESGERDPRRQQAVLRKRLGPPERQG